MEPLAARASLLVDNLMDLSHETYLHGGYIGTPEVAETPITTEVDEEAGIVYVSRHMDDAECPPFYAKSTGIQGRITRWQDIEFTRRACTCCTAGSRRSASCRTTTAPTRTPSTSRSSTRSRRRRSTHARLLGGGARLRARRRGGLGLPAREQPHRRPAGRRRAERAGEVIAGEADGYQELSINIDTGGLAARRLIDRMAGEDAASLGRGSRRPMNDLLPGEPAVHAA